MAQKRRKPADFRHPAHQHGDNVEPFRHGVKDALAALGLVDGRNIPASESGTRDHIERYRSSPNRRSGRRRAYPRFGPPAIPRGAAGDEHDPDRPRTADLFASGLIARRRAADRLTYASTDLARPSRRLRAGGAEAINVLSSAMVLASQFDAAVSSNSRCERIVLDM